MNSLGKIILEQISPELNICKYCERLPVMRRREEGLAYVWRVECACGSMTGACLGQIQAVVKWQKLNILATQG